MILIQILYLNSKNYEAGNSSNLKLPLCFLEIRKIYNLYSLNTFLHLDLYSTQHILFDNPDKEWVLQTTEMNKQILKMK